DLSQTLIQLGPHGRLAHVGVQPAFFLLEPLPERLCLQRLHGQISFLLLSRFSSPYSSMSACSISRAVCVSPSGYSPTASSSRRSRPSWRLPGLLRLETWSCLVRPT